MRLSMHMKPSRLIPEPTLLITVLHSLRLDTGYRKGTHTQKKKKPEMCLNEVTCIHILITCIN